MKYWMIAAILAASTGTAMAARIGFQGQLVVTEAPAACIADGTTIGNTFQTTFLPAGLGDNGPDTYMTLYGPRNAISLRLIKSGLDANSPYTSVYINSYGKYSVAPAGVVTTSLVSPAPSATSPFVNVRIKITNFSTASGCTATLEGSFVRRLP